ncbi:hypothetical protein BJ508DRAFT_40084 [Ascobolus immersus RN42]|uniref:Uncharacterized protein n=1 Tax=Ascobolus immersus RN42 TaxID=1160509 RepID=A0A3N4HJX6_ASCIM|nr:hypothetical protein BJ508DRAFT_40084 [Ascobolus immersus RN42]
MAHSFQWPAMGRSAGDRAAEPFAASSPLSSQRSSDSTRAMATSSPSFVISSSDNTSAISSSRQPPNSENKRPLWYWYYTFRDQYYLPIPERDEPIIRGTQVRLPEQATEEPPHVLKNKIRHLYEHCPGALEFIHRRMQKYRKKRIVETQGRSTKEEDRAAFAKYLSALMLREVKLYFERMTVAGSTRVQVPREIPAVPFAGQSTTSRTTPAAALRSIERRESVSSDDTTPVAPSFTTADESYSSLASMGPPEIDSRTEEEKALEKAATEHYFREQFILERNRKLANGLASGDTSTLSNSSTSSRYRDVEEINLDFDRSDLHTPVPHQSNVNYGEPRDTTPQQPLKQRQRNPEAQGSPPPYSPPAQQQHRSDASRPHNRTNEDRKGKGKQRAEADSESKQPSSKALDLSSDTETDPCSAIETRSISYAGPSNSAANSVPVGKPNTTMSEFKFNYQVKTNPSSRQLLKPKSKVIRSPPTVQPASVNPNAPQQIFGPPSSSVSAQPLFSEQLSFQPPPPPPASQQQQHQQHQSSQANQWNNQQQSLSQPDHRPFGSQPPQHNGRPFSQPAHQPFYSQSQEEDHRPFSQPQTQQPTQNFYRQDTQASSRSLPVQTYSQPNHRSLTRQESQESSQNSSQDSDFDTRRSSQTTIPSLSQQNSWNERTAGQQGGFKQPGLETLAEVSSNSSQSTAMRDGAGRATSRGGDDARNDGRVYGQGDGYGQGYGQSSRGYEGEYSLAPEEYHRRSIILNLYLSHRVMALSLCRRVMVRSISRRAVRNPHLNRNHKATRKVIRSPAQVSNNRHQTGHTPHPRILRRSLFRIASTGRSRPRLHQLFSPPSIWTGRRMSEDSNGSTLRPHLF